MEGVLRWWGPLSKKTRAAWSFASAGAGMSTTYLLRPHEHSPSRESAELMMGRVCCNSGSQCFKFRGLNSEGIEAGICRWWWWGGEEVEAVCRTSSYVLGASGHWIRWRIPVNASQKWHHLWLAEPRLSTIHFASLQRHFNDSPQLSIEYLWFMGYDIEGYIKEATQ